MAEFISEKNLKETLWPNINKKLLPTPTKADAGKIVVGDGSGGYALKTLDDILGVTNAIATANKSSSSANLYYTLTIDSKGNKIYSWTN